MVIFNDISHTKRSDMRFVIAFYCFSVLVLRKTETEMTSSIFHADEEELVNKKERFFFTGDSEANQKIWSFHRLQFNESIIIRMKHSSYAYSNLNRRLCVITFNFLDYMDREIIRFSVIPGAAEFQLACAKQDIDHITFPNNDYEKYYEFIIVFSSVGIMLFYMQDFYLKSTRCVNTITEITKFQHTVTNVKNFEAMLEVGFENARIPYNWHIVKHIPIDHRIIIKYYPDMQSIFSIRLTDRNGITAITVTVDYRKGILFIKRAKLDSGNNPCINFGNSLDFTSLITTRIQIAILPYLYKVGIILNKGARNVWCSIPGHHLSPYDIRQVQEVRTATLPSVIDEEEKNLVNTMEQFYFVGESESNQMIQSFHPLQFNDSIIIRMKHSSYSWWVFNSSQCVIMFIFLDILDHEVIRFTIIPGAAQFKLECKRHDADHTTFPNNDYEKYYEFVIIFSSVGIMLFYNEDFYIKSVKCINRIVDITHFIHSVHNTEGFEVMMEVRSENVILYTRRERLDKKGAICVNFGSTIRFVSQMLGKIEISIFPYLYKIGMKIERDKSRTSMKECLVSGHHLSPYDIRQIILGSTNEEMIAYAYDVSPA
ncbi:Oligomycin resistance ATP-dependent permease YOR1 [Dirofilaria immitis]